MLIGKSGEFIPREAAEIEFLSHRRHHRAQVATDHHGRIWLGPLHGIESVHISTSTSLAEHQCYRKWLLPAHSHYTSQVESSHTRYIGTDESLHLPYLGSANEISASEFSLTAHPTLESFHSYLSLDGDSSARTIVIRPLPRGTYELYVGSSTDCSRRIYTIHVTEKAHRYNLVVDQLDDESSSSSDVSESFVVSPTQLFHSDPLTPTPRVSTITTNADGSFDIAIMNVTETVCQTSFHETEPNILDDRRLRLFDVTDSRALVCNVVHINSGARTLPSKYATVAIAAIEPRQAGHDGVSARAFDGHRRDVHYCSSQCYIDLWQHALTSVVAHAPMESEWHRHRD